MPRDTTLSALNECSRAALRATDGHHRRWAVARCVRQLVQQGTAPSLAERCAAASVAVAQAVNAKAAELQLGTCMDAWLARKQTVISAESSTAQSMLPGADR